MRIKKTIIFLVASLFLASSNTFAQEFFSALEAYDTNTALQMLEAQTNLAHEAYYGKLPLIEAAYSGDIRIVKRMIELGADVNAEGDTLNTSGYKMTALNQAAQAGFVDICQLLLEKGADPNHTSARGTALHLVFSHSTYRSRTNRDVIAKMLLDYGGNPFTENGFQKTTPLALAITRGDGSLVPLMLDTNRPIKFVSHFVPRKPAVSRAQQLSRLLGSHGPALLLEAAQHDEMLAVQALLDVGVSAKADIDANHTLLQAFALGEAEREKPSAGSESGKIERRPPLEHLNQIRDLLIKGGAVYDVFCATAFDDLERAQELRAADEDIARSKDRLGQTPLHWAVHADRPRMTSFWITNGAFLPEANADHQTALHLAAANGSIDQLKLLLQAGAPIDVRDADGQTPLDVAIKAKQQEAIHLLLSDTAPRSHSEKGLNTKLHQAAKNGDIAALTAILETETNLEPRDELGRTPFQLAVLSGHLATAAFLLDKEADVNARDPDGNTALHNILLHNAPVSDLPSTNWLDRINQDVDRETLSQYLIPPNPPTEWTMRHGWLPNPLPQAVCFLLACKIDVTATNRAGVSALRLITDRKVNRDLVFLSLGERPIVIQLLVHHGADLNERDVNGDAALHHAVLEEYQADADQVALLLAAGADINVTDSHDRTPLHRCAEKIWAWSENDDGTPFQLLVKSNANLNAKDNEGLTPLHLLALSDSSFKVQAVELLLKAGADPNSTDKRGRTPAHLFLDGDFFHRAGVGESVALLAKAGANLSAKDKNGETPLHYLATLGSDKPMFFIRGIGDTLLAAKVDVNARDNEGDTPLHLAANTGTRDVYEWLKSHGADLKATNKLGQIPHF